MTTPLDQTRAEFETHRMSKNGGRRPQTWGVACAMMRIPPPIPSITDNYVRSEDQAAWEAWQAAIASRAVPEGWQLVPVAPTDEMMGAVVSSMDEHLMGKDGAEAQYREDWAAMLRAAPTPPTAAEAAKETT